MLRQQGSLEALISSLSLRNFPGAELMGAGGSGAGLELQRGSVGCLEAF